MTGCVAAALYGSRDQLSAWFETPPTLAAISEMIHEGKYREAERGLALQLARHPDHRETNLLMAQLLIDRPNPQPEFALEHLRRVRSQYPPLRAAVLVQEGKAHYMAHRLVRSEAAWRDAVRTDPDVAEAGWLLIQQYYVQGRDDEVHALAMERHARETDPRDRVRYLLELIREDVDRLAAAGVIPWLEPAVQADPDDLHSALALGRALVKEGRADEGFGLLRKARSKNAESVSPWVALLAALGDAGDIDALEKELGELPPSISARPVFEEYRGRIALERRRFADAVTSYQTALQERPRDPRLNFRMSRALRLAGQESRARHFEAIEAEINDTLKRQKDTYREASADPALGLEPRPEIYQRLAELRERLGKADEALAWHQLVLRDNPLDDASRKAAARLSSHSEHAPD